MKSDSVWISENKNGYILNVMRRNLEIHTSICPKIQPYNIPTNKSRTGGASYKVYSDNLNELINWKKTNLIKRTDGLKGCETCGSN